jgi:hypothetical protein
MMTAVVRLREGKNTVRIDAVNGGKKASLTYMITYKKAAQKDPLNNGGRGVVQAVAKKPVFQNVSPRSSSETVAKSTYLFKARVQNVSKKSDINFTVNGQKITAFSFNPATGEITASLTLKTGSNTIQITAKNGNQTASRSYTIKYEAKPAVNKNVVKPGETKPGGGIQQGAGGVRRGG